MVPTGLNLKRCLALNLDNRFIGILLFNVLIKTNMSIVEVTKRVLIR